MKKQNAINKTVLILLLGLGSLTACFEGDEGCLDVDALNFDVSADEACGDCCNYPNISLTFSHKVYQGSDTLNFGYQTPYFNNLGQYFAFDQISYYISDVGFITEEGNLEAVLDLVDLPVLEDNDTTFIEISDNFILTAPDNFRSQIAGTFIYAGEVTALKIGLGLPEIVHQSEPSLWSNEDHPLAEQIPPMYDETQARYLYNRVEFFRDTSDFLAIPDVIQITEEDDRINLLLPVSGAIPSGFNVNVTLEVDYLRWFAGVDILNDSNEVIKNKIVANLADSFQIIAFDLSQ